jgi:cold-inducible RNA-binding protein
LFARDCAVFAERRPLTHCDINADADRIAKSGPSGSKLGGTMGKKIFVGNLAFETTSQDLEGLFASAGTCESASVITDRNTGRSRGFAFVEMSSASEAQKAIADLNGRELHGRALRVSEANERPSGGGGGGGGGGRGGRRSW